MSGAQLHPCVPTGNDRCTVAYPADQVGWAVRLVPSGSIGQAAANGDANPPKITSRTGAASDPSAPTTKEDNIPPGWLSSDPQLAAAQRAFWRKHQEILRERQWVEKVRMIIGDYQRKLANVVQHSQQQASSLMQDKQQILEIIKRQREKKLEAELTAALQSLQQLEGTSSVLAAKINQLGATKVGLAQTITQIQSALGRQGGAPGAPGAPRLPGLSAAPQQQLLVAGPQLSGPILSIAAQSASQIPGANQLRFKEEAAGNARNLMTNLASFLQQAQGYFPQLTTPSAGTTLLETDASMTPSQQKSASTAMSFAANPSSSENVDADLAAAEALLETADRDAESTGLTAKLREDTKPLKSNARPHRTPEQRMEELKDKYLGITKQ